MTDVERLVQLDIRDATALDPKRLGAAFWVPGYARDTRPPDAESIRLMLESQDLFFAAGLRGDSTVTGGVIGLHSRWEEGVIGTPFVRVAYMAAKTYAGAERLALAFTERLGSAGVTLAAASPGLSPTFVKVALERAGFYLAGEAMTLSADVETIWPTLSRVPPSDGMRFADPSDAERLAEIARSAFVTARYTSDPFLDPSIGPTLYADWARNLVLSDEHEVVVLEEGGEVLGFASVQRDTSRRPRLPALLVVNRRVQAAGVGPRLVRRTVELYRARGVRYPMIGTERTNVDVNALYLRLGYRIQDCTNILHWTPGGSARRR